MAALVFHTTEAFDIDSIVYPWLFVINVERHFVSDTGHCLTAIYRPVLQSTVYPWLAILFFELAALTDILPDLSGKADG